jgi:hypothetical protein
MVVHALTKVRACSATLSYITSVNMIMIFHGFLCHCVASMKGGEWGKYETNDGPRPPLSMGGVKNNNQQAKGASNEGGGWQERVKDHMTTMVGNKGQQVRAADDEGINKEGNGGKGNCDGDEGGGQKRE